MIEKSFDVIASNLYRTFSESYNLNDFIYSQYKHNNLHEYFEHLKPLFYLNLKSSEDQKDLLKIVNTCLYVYFEIFPELRKNINLFNYNVYKVKTLKCKQNWYELVNNTNLRSSKNKYIEKELESVDPMYHDALRSKRLQTIMDWVLDESQLLSDFIYLPDLVYKQKQIIIQIDPVILLLKEIDNYQNHPIMTCIKNYGDEESKLIMIPDTLFKNPTEFVMPDLRLDQIDYTESDGQYEFYIDKNSGLIAAVPALEQIKDDIAGLTLDLKVDKVTSNAFDYKIIVSALQICLDDLFNKKPLSTIVVKDVCELAGLPGNTYSYSRIRSVLMLAKTKQLITIEEGRRIHYNHINWISEPASNEDKEQYFQVEWGSHIHKEIELKKYKYIFSEQFSHKSKLASLISRLIVADVKSDTVHLNYTDKDIINATLISGKPSVIKKNIVDALNEIVEGSNPLITEYISNEDRTHFKLKVNSNVIFKNFEKPQLESFNNTQNLRKPIV